MCFILKRIVKVRRGKIIPDSILVETVCKHGVPMFFQRIADNDWWRKKSGNAGYRNIQLSEVPEEVVDAAYAFWAKQMDMKDKKEKQKAERAELRRKEKEDKKRSEPSPLEKKVNRSKNRLFYWKKVQEKAEKYVEQYGKLVKRLEHKLNKEKQKKESGL